MKSIAEIFDNSKELLDSISYFIDKYIGASLLRKCGITKIVDSVTENSVYEYADSPLSRLIGNAKESKFLKKCVSASQLLTDKILAGFAAASPYRMFETGNFFRNYKKDTFYRFDLMPKANWERLQLETAGNVIRDIESQTAKNHKCALIFDDSLYARTGGKGTDLCGKVFDHNEYKMRSDGSTIPAKLIYARNRNKRRDWVCFVCTDLSLSEREILETYMLRWQIVTYFKLTKSYLKLRTA